MKEGGNLKKIKAFGSINEDGLADFNTLYENAALYEFDKFYRTQTIIPASKIGRNRYIDVELALLEMYDDILKGNVNAPREDYRSYFNTELNKRAINHKNELEGLIDSFYKFEEFIAITNFIKECIFTNNRTRIDFRGLSSEIDSSKKLEGYNYNFKQSISDRGTVLTENSSSVVKGLNTLLINSTSDPTGMFAPHKFIVYRQEWDIELTPPELLRVLIIQTSDKEIPDEVCVTLTGNSGKLIYGKLHTLNKFTDDFVNLG